MRIWRTRLEILIKILSFLLSDSLSGFELLLYNSVKCSGRSTPGDTFTPCTLLISLFTTTLTSAGSNVAAIVFYEHSLVGD